MLAAREEFEPLLEAYLLGLPDGAGDPRPGRAGARVTAVYTALSRAEWALARVAGGEGALAGKYRHPAWRRTSAPCSGSSRRSRSSSG